MLVAVELPLSSERSCSCSCRKSAQKPLLVPDFTDWIPVCFFFPVLKWGACCYCTGVNTCLTDSLLCPHSATVDTDICWVDVSTSVSCLLLNRASINRTCPRSRCEDCQHILQMCMCHRLCTITQTETLWHWSRNLFLTFFLLVLVNTVVPGTYWKYSSEYEVFFHNISHFNVKMRD